MSNVRLSVCIATYSRAAYIRETLENILEQCTEEVEVVVLDGASPDNTAEVVRGVQERHPRLRYVRETTNSGFDQGYDKAVGYARGEYCWLLSDDDLLAPGAVAAVLRAIEDAPDVVVVNAEVRDKEMRTVLKATQLAAVGDRTYEATEIDALLADVGSHLTFIGAVVVRRSVWTARPRDPYYGSQFIHICVLFQPHALQRVRVLAHPFIRIRYGNALWTARGFEIWMETWPSLVWSFTHLAPQTRAAVTPRHPARSLRSLLWFRAIGAYGPQERRSLLLARGIPHHRLAGLLAMVPASLVNAAAALHVRLSRPSDAGLKLYELARVRGASALARRLHAAAQRAQCA